MIESASVPKRGTVYLAFDGLTQGQHWSGYWDQLPDGPPDFLEKGPGWLNVAEAIAWALARGRIVLLRLDDQSGYWCVGDGIASVDFEVEGTIKPRLQISSS